MYIFINYHCCPLTARVIGIDSPITRAGTTARHRRRRISRRIDSFPAFLDEQQHRQARKTEFETIK